MWMLALLALLLPQDDKARTRDVGIYDLPNDGKDIRRIVAGNPGGKPGCNLGIMPAVLHVDGEEEEVWEKALTTVKENGGDRLGVIFNMTPLITRQWLEEEELHDMTVEILKSKNGDLVKGFMVAMEPFTRSLKINKTPLDLKRVWDLVNELRRAAKSAGRKIRIVVNYNSVFPLLRVGGNARNAQWWDFTDKKEFRNEFFWGGEWKHTVKDPKYNGGKPLIRGYGFFGEDVAMIGWTGNAGGLQMWWKRITGEIDPSRLHILLGWDTGEDKPEVNDAYVKRLRQVVDFGLKNKVAGFWIWPWSKTKFGGRDLKGVHNWWETDAEDKKYPKRYADLVESIP